MIAQEDNEDEPAIPCTGDESIEEESKNVTSKVTWHIIPLVWTISFFSYLSRVNLANTHIVMMREIQLTEYQYGEAVAAFYISFVVFPLPANLILERMCTNTWLALLVCVWGCITMLSVFITNAASLFAFRFFLGVAEAGLSPGVVYYITMWFGEGFRARQLSLIQTAIPFAYAIGGLMSSLVLGHMDGIWGFTGWRWLYLITGIPPIFLSFVIYVYLPTTPHEARFLSDRERKILAASRSMAASVWTASPRTSPSLFWSTVCNSKNWMLSFCGMFFMGTLAGVNGFAPEIVYESGSPLFVSNLLIVIPNCIAVFALLFWSYHSDYTQERFWHVFLAMFLALLALSGCTVFVFFMDLVLVVGLLTIYQSAMCSGYSVFIAFMCDSVLGSTSIGIALYYTVVGFGGWFGPFMMGYARDLTGDHVVSLALMCASAGFGIGLFSIIHISQRTTHIERGSPMKLQLETESVSVGTYELKDGSGAAIVL